MGVLIALDESGHIVEEVEEMLFRDREREKVVISKAKARDEAKALHKSGAGDKDMEDVREGIWIGIKNTGEKNSIAKDNNVREEVKVF